MAVSKEIKAKLDACKTKEEVLKLVADEGIELPDEALDQIAGGSFIIGGEVSVSQWFERYNWWTGDETYGGKEFSVGGFIASDKDLPGAK